MHGAHETIVHELPSRPHVDGAHGAHRLANVGWMLVEENAATELGRDASHAADGRMVEAMHGAASGTAADGVDDKLLDAIALDLDIDHRVSGE